MQLGSAPPWTPPGRGLPGCARACPSASSSAFLTVAGLLRRHCCSRVSGANGPAWARSRGFARCRHRCRQRRRAGPRVCRGHLRPCRYRRLRRLAYAAAATEHGWSRAVLVHHLEARTVELSADARAQTVVGPAHLPAQASPPREAVAVIMIIWRNGDFGRRSLDLPSSAEALSDDGDDQLRRCGRIDGAGTNGRA